MIILERHSAARQFHYQRFPIVFCIRTHIRTVRHIRSWHRSKVFCVGALDSWIVRQNDADRIVRQGDVKQSKQRGRLIIFNTWPGRYSVQDRLASECLFLCCGPVCVVVGYFVFICSLVGNGHEYAVLLALIVYCFLVFPISECQYNVPNANIMPHYLKAMHGTAHGKYELWTVPRGMLVVVFFCLGRRGPSWGYKRCKHIR